MPQYFLEGTGDAVGCSHSTSTLLTGVEKPGENWPGARGYGCMASSPSYADCCLHRNQGLVGVTRAVQAAPARCVAQQCCLLSAGAQREKGGSAGTQRRRATLRASV